IESSLNTVILCAPTNFVRDWIKSKYSMVILQLFQHYNNTIKSIEIITKELPGTTQTVIELPTKTFADIGSSELNSANIFSTLDVRFTFDNFVVGAPNELAYAAARAVAESSGAVSESNPLFLYGGVGLGKTHLMHAIGWYIKQNNPNRKVIYMSAEKFMYQFVKALRNKEVISFKEKFRSVDVLMIDDIQFICGKDSTQEEFFHTFNTLIDNNRQMVISCDRSPSDLDN
ncbi:ATP-binding protein, partial [Salmonella enterica subsp. enterica serovar Enteritidis]|nr:ATP-binding protein [Salmonella enterica subsp. enterica serovar Enteritidis]